MFHTVNRRPLQQHWLDTLSLEYWRQVIRLTRALSRVQDQIAEWKAYLLPLRDWLWLPLISGMVGVLLGLVFTTIIPII